MNPGDTVMGRGVHRGLTLRDVHAIDPSYVRWLASDNHRYPERAAAAAFLAACTLTEIVAIPHEEARRCFGGPERPEGVYR